MTPTRLLSSLSSTTRKKTTHRMSSFEWTVKEKSLNAWRTTLSITKGYWKMSFFQLNKGIKLRWIWPFNSANPPSSAKNNDNFWNSQFRKMPKHYIKHSKKNFGRKFNISLKNPYHIIPMELKITPLTLMISPLKSNLFSKDNPNSLFRPKNKD